MGATTSTTALVTGAGTGIGRAVVRGFVQRGRVSAWWEGARKSWRRR